MVDTHSLVKFILTWKDPQHNKSLVDLKTIVKVEKVANKLTIKVQRAYSVINEVDWYESLKAFISQQIDSAFDLIVNKNVAVKLTVSAAKHPNIKNIVAVLSGKGGVGKSTITSNLAVSLVLQGYKVGVLDADIHGPSQVLMLGGDESINHGEEIIPVKCQGVHVVSMGAILKAGTAIAWRGPIASKALLQLYQQTKWPELDFLLIDCPPGTSDLLLTITKQIPIVGGILVTTPQVAAVMDAERAGDFLNKLTVPILGVVENMSQKKCSACGHVEQTFGFGGGDFLAKKFETNCWLKIPLDEKVCFAGEQGVPAATQDVSLQQLGVDFTLSLLDLPKYNKLARMNVEIKKDGGN